jgi:uncharacterized membrane protein
MNEQKDLSEQILKNVETINHHQDRHQQNTKTHHRVLDKIGSVFGQPQFLYGQIVFFAVWILCSNLANREIIDDNFLLFDPDYHTLEVVSVLTSTGVLVYQTRQGKLTEERAHLMLQVDLLAEQKIAKLISLVEELRTDLPNVKNRQDPQAEEMQQSADAQAILEVLQQTTVGVDSSLEHRAISSHTKT